MLRRRKQKLTQKDLDRANIGDRYRQAEIGRIPNELDYKNYITRYIDGLTHRPRDGVGLLLHGKHDMGKTGTGVIVLKHAILCGFTALFLEADRIAPLVFEKRRFDAESTWIERAESVDFLLLDDLGMEHTKEYGLSLVEGLLRFRHNKHRPTVVTTNLQFKDIEERYGLGVMGIFKESLVPVLVEGKDWRAEKAEANKAIFMGKSKRNVG